VDLLTAFAYPLPITVICELLGVPPGDRHLFRMWIGPLVAGLMSPFEEFAAAATALVHYTRELLARKRAEPADDLLSALVAVRDGADALTEDELTSMVFLLLAAGHETTVNLILNGMLALLEHPDQLAGLRTRPDRIGAAVEELLRYDGPVQTALPLVCVAPMTLAGIELRPREIVLVSPLAASRDPATAHDAARLDVFRDSPHLAFGYGVHHCLGAPLARVEGRIALGTLVSRFPRMRLAVPAAELVRPAGMVINGLTALPVTPR